MLKLEQIPQELTPDLVIKACATDTDIEKVAALNNEIHGPAEGAAVRRWLGEGHPQLDPAGWLFVEDRTTGQAVATLSLMPISWRYGPAPLPVAELGFVSTRPAFRKRGLQRALSAAFDRIALANGYTLAAIEGIPYFYRQFGYEYALPLFDSRCNLPLDRLPASSPEGISVRPAGPADAHLLKQIFDQQSVHLDITTERSEAMWHYFLAMPPGTAFGMQLYVLEADGRTAGYLTLAPSGWTNRLNIMELGLAQERLGARTEDAMIQAALHFASSQARAGEHETVGLQLPADHPALAYARAQGIKEEGIYGWQMKVLDPVRFLNTIAPALAPRLASVPQTERRDTLSFNLYRQKIELSLSGNQIHATTLAQDAACDVSLPPNAATQLWLGWRTFAELDDWYKDAGAKDEVRPLLDALFPPANVHIYLSY